MADVQIETNLATPIKRPNPAGGGRSISPVWVSPSTAYVFLSNNSDRDIAYKKTTDSGATWSSPTVIDTGTSVGYSVWDERAEAGNTGTEIGIAWQDATDDEVYFEILDTSDDSLLSGGKETVDSTTAWDFISSSRGNGYVNLGKLRDGRWVVTVFDNSGNTATRIRSTGGTWSDLAADAVEAQGDMTLFLPGNNAADEDFWLIYYDISANEISLKHWDDSAGSFAETSIRTGVTHQAASSISFDAMPLSDENGMVIIMDPWTGGGDNRIHAYMVTGDTTVTLENDVEGTDVSRRGCSVMVNLQNDDVYVVYGDGGIASNQDVNYKKATRSGDTFTWGSEVTFSDAAASDFNPVGGGTIVNDDGGRFCPTWVDDNNSDLLTNSGNSIEIAAVGGGGLSIPVAMASYRRMHQSVA